MFYDAARAEWTATGWQHHSGKNTLVNFKEVRALGGRVRSTVQHASRLVPMPHAQAVKNRMKDAWDEAIVPELQKFYFKVPELGCAALRPC